MSTYVKSELTTNTPPVSSSTTASVSTGVSEGEVKQLKELSIVMVTVMITQTTEIVYMVTVCYLIQAH